MVVNSRHCYKMYGFQKFYFAKQPFKIRMCSKPARQQPSVIACPSFCLLHLTKGVDIVMKVSKFHAGC